MATAVKTTETVVKITGVTLQLTEAEADTLSRLLSKIGGFDPETGHRDRLNGIGSALYKCGFDLDFNKPQIATGWIFEREGRTDRILREV